MNDIKLNTAQRRSIRIVLTNFEKQLRQALVWLQGYEENAFLFKRSLKISEAQKIVIKDKIEDALIKVEKLARDLNIEKSEENVAGLFRGEFSVSWADLTDLQSRKLQRYGKTDPTLTINLDPNIRDLANTAFDLATILNQSLPADEEIPLIKDKTKRNQE